jgi:CheY-like chemotaxis protein
VNGPPRVLLVDDTPEIAELLTFALRDRGFEVVATGFSPSIGDLVARAGADAVVLDLSTLNMGESLFDALRAEPRHASLPVVFVSDTPAEADAALASRRAEHVLLIPKPFTGAQIARALGDLLAVPAPGSPAPG